MLFSFFFFFQAEDGIRDVAVTGVQTCALPISLLGPPCYGSIDAAAARDRLYRRRDLQGLRALHRGVPAAGSVDVGGGEPHGLPLSAPARRLHWLRAVLQDLPGLLLRGLPRRGRIGEH